MNCVTVVGLGVNPDKTETVIFSRKLTNIQTPNIVALVVRGTAINISEEAKYLGLILDRKLSWKKKWSRKATIALYTCKNAKRWRLQPKVGHWLYIAVVRLIVLYVICVW